MTSRNATRSRVTPEKATAPKESELTVVSPPIGETAEPPEGRLRLVKVLIQPVLMLDDGDGLREIQHPVIEVKGAEWPEWATTAYGSEFLESLRMQLVPVAAADG